MLYEKNGKIRDGRRIVIVNEGALTLNPTEEMILADGWTPYTPAPAEYVPTVDDQLRELFLEEYNQRTDITDEAALKRPLLVYPWEEYIGKGLTKGQVVSHDGKLWRVRQDISNVLETWSPSLDTAALYGVIEVEASGTIDDPIEYTPPMEIFAGKYYVQNDVKYRCTRDSGQELTHNLSDLVGTYVEPHSQDAG